MLRDGDRVKEDVTLDVPERVREGLLDTVVDDVGVLVSLPLCVCERLAPWLGLCVIDGVAPWLALCDVERVFDSLRLCDCEGGSLTRRLAPRHR